MASDELFQLSLIELAEHIRDGDLSPVEVTTSLLERIDDARSRPQRLRPGDEGPGNGGCPSRRS